MHLAIRNHFVKGNAAGILNYSRMFTQLRYSDEVEQVLALSVRPFALAPASTRTRDVVADGVIDAYSSIE